MTEKGIPDKHGISANSTLPETTGAARFGMALKRHPSVIALIQWAAVLLYIALLLTPLIAPSPETGRLSRLVFWGIGWPLIFTSVILSGRFWCGLFCPDGTLTELISRYGKKRSIPHWIRWKGWPCAVLVGTTLYGQAAGFHEHFSATLFLLGTPSVLALVTGYLYGNGKRIWCMYLCPANGLFGILAKQSLLHFHVDKDKWNSYNGTPERINCAPLINIRQMQSASACHACGRCAGYRHAVALATRSPSREILTANGNTIDKAETFLLLWGIAGICTASLTWHGNLLYPFYLNILSATGIPVSIFLPLFILCIGSTVSMVLYGLLRLADRLAAHDTVHWQQLACCLIPLISWGILLGLCRNSLAIWQEYGLVLSWTAIPATTVLALATLFSLRLCARTLRHCTMPSRLAALAAFCIPLALLNLLWLPL